MSLKHKFIETLIPVTERFSNPEKRKKKKKKDDYINSLAKEYQFTKFK